MDLNQRSLTSADGSFLGYLFQIERVIMWLSRLPETAIIGVEVTDDIVVKLDNGKSIAEIYEQAKHTQTKSAPYSDKSEDLWKTLAIWINAVNEGKIDPSTSIFSLLSNIPLPKSRFAWKLDNASFEDDTTLNGCCDELVKMAASLRKDLKSYGQIVLDCPKDILKQIINRVSITDSTYVHDRIETSKILKDNLHLSDDLPVNHILEKLFGFVAIYLIDNWRERKEAWISVKAFNQQLTQLIAEYKGKPFFEKTTDLLPVTDSDVKKNRSKIYVEQLKLIGCNEEEILESMHNYLRALAERNRFAKDGEISSEKFEQYFNDLLENWKNISRPRFRSCEAQEHVKVGYNVFYETIKYKGKLNNYEPEQHYTYKGAYHHLSNELQLGWHPKWQELLSK